MKLLIVGDGHSTIHEKAFEKAFGSLKNSVLTFYWHPYFKDYHLHQKNRASKYSLKSIYYRFQNKYLLGPVFIKLNRDLATLVSKTKPDLIFIYRGTHLLPDTIRKIKNNNCLIFGYNNDDPFGKSYKFYFWRHYLASLKYYDHIFYYRKKNKQDYHTRGFNNTSLLRSYYIKEQNYQNPRAIKKHEVVFIGHFENDGRDKTLLHLFKKGIKLRIFGTNWQASRLYKQLIKHNGPIIPAYKNYNTLLNSAKIALVFLSKINNDTYTRRNFEIPAAGSFMLSEYSSELTKLFTEGKEAEYFRSNKELLYKITYYLANNKKREEIARNGHYRLKKDHHEVIDRAKEISKKYTIWTAPLKVEQK